MSVSEHTQRHLVTSKPHPAFTEVSRETSFFSLKLALKNCPLIKLFSKVVGPFLSLAVIGYFPGALPIVAWGPPVLIGVMKVSPFTAGGQKMPFCLVADQAMSAIFTKSIGAQEPAFCRTLT